MSWFAIALIGPVCVACANQTDKYLIEKYLKHGEVGALIIFSSLFSAIALPIILVLHPSACDVGLERAALLAMNGMLTVLAMLCYFYALNEDTASGVVPFYQTIPIFAFGLGYVVLGETISRSQVLASSVILTGAAVLSFEMHPGGLRFKRKVVLYMLAASLMYAVNSVLFKRLAVDAGFWPALFWDVVGKLGFGLGFLGLVPSYRRQFLALTRHSKAAALGLSSMSELLVIAGEAATAYATMLAPVFLVLMVHLLQPLFVLIIGVGLTLLFPHTRLESLTRRTLTHKLSGIGLMCVGACFLGA
jgi:uncharacterized membrane protein